jgi:hypothetical protein
MGKLKVFAGLVQTWFQGKKTMLGGLVLIAAGVVGIAFGKLPVDQGVVVAGFGISICGWSAKANRHQAELLAALTAVAQVGVTYRTLGKVEAEKAAVEAIRQNGPAIITAVNKEFWNQGDKA